MTDNDTSRLEGKIDGALVVLAELKGMLGATLPGLQRRQDDHETRLRRLERFRYSVPSVAFLSLLVSLAGLVVIYLTGVR